MSRRAEARRAAASKSFPSSVQLDVDAFIGTFINVYQARNNVIIRRHGLDTRPMIEEGRNLAAGVFKLRLDIAANGDEVVFSSVVLKIPQMSTSYNKLENFRVYEREAYMYETVFQRMYEFWKCERVSPRFYVASQSGFLALENLEEDGFLVPPKNTPLDLTESKAVLKTLAHFHAHSVRYFQEYGVEEFDSRMSFKGAEGTSTGLFVSLFGKIRRYVIPSLSAGDLEKWTRFEENCAVTMKNAYVFDGADKFNVIIHGDIQHNNVMLRKKDGQCRLIDFQVSRRGSPVLDLIYFIVSSVKFEVFQQHREAIFDYYLETLNGMLAELECADRYTRDELNADYEKYRLFGIFVLSGLTPILEAGMTSMTSWKDEKENRFDLFIKSQAYIHSFKNWIALI